MLSSRALRCCPILNYNYKSFNRQLRSSSLVFKMKSLTSRIRPEFNMYFEDEPLKPEQVGLTQFVGDPPEITGIIQVKKTDFQVHEIDLNGNVVRLTDLGPPNDKLLEKEPYFTYCTMYKEGLSADATVKLLEKKLWVPKSCINWADIKDAEGQTSQRVSFKNIPADRLIEFTKSFPMIKLGNYSYSLDRLSLGDLQGNLFKMLMRKIKFSKLSSSHSETIKKVLKNFRDFGFINYFGLQNFKTLGGGVPPYILGQTILQQNWEHLFDQILQHKVSDKERAKIFKSMWIRERDPCKIVREHHDYVHKTFDNEVHLLNGLSKYYNKGKGDLIKVYLSIPNQNRQVLILSFQSLLWNHIASFRVSQFGLKVIPGDMVRIPSTNQTEINTRSHDVNIKGGENLKVLTEKDLENNHPYSIFDVLLPAPGHLVTSYPNPIIDDYFQKLLRQHQMTTEDFTAFHKAVEGETGHYGFYRHLVVKPENLKHKIIFYDPAFELDVPSIMPSDLDRMKGNNGNKLVDSRGDYLGLILEFSMPTSSDPTMALRQIFKSD